MEDREEKQIITREIIKKELTGEKTMSLIFAFIGVGIMALFAFGLVSFAKSNTVFLIIVCVLLAFPSGYMVFLFAESLLGLIAAARGDFRIDTDEVVKIGYDERVYKNFGRKIKDKPQSHIYFAKHKHITVSHGVAEMTSEGEKFYLTVFNFSRKNDPVSAFNAKYYTLAESETEIQNDESNF